jgi:hypothetical protein
MNSNEKSERAKKRWRLLRRALTKQTVEKTTGFPGYCLISGTITASDDDSLLGALSYIDYTTNVVQQIESSLLASLALNTSLRQIIFSFDHESLSLGRPPNLIELSQSLLSSCDLTSCEVESLPKEADHTESSALRISFEPSTASLCFAIKSYTSPTVAGVTLALTRERVRLQISLDELTTHHTTSIDNTGNICVWDCETTLAWAVLEQLENILGNLGRSVVVTELGSGMAGLAALSLCRSLPPCSTIYVTDGHINSIQNNMVNLRLMTVAELRPSTVDVFCQKLKWSLEEDQDKLDLPEEADLVLLSDCAHFEHYHGELLWTLIRATKVDGQVWMCHPERGNSLWRFLQLIDSVNDSASYGPLLRIEYWNHDLLDERHQTFLERHLDTYDPNVHRPRIYRLQKLRKNTEIDRAAIKLHIQKRDCN